MNPFEDAEAKFDERILSIFARNSADAMDSSNTRAKRKAE